VKYEKDRFPSDAFGRHLLGRYTTKRCRHSIASGYSGNPITTFGASGFGLQYRAAGILQKAGWSISLKMKLASDYLSLPQWDSPLECDRLRTVSTSWKEAKPLTAKGKKCVVAIQTPAIAKKGVESSFAEETPGVSGCDLYSYK
jgi:hypothetical protein